MPMIGKIVPVKFCKFELADAASDQRISHEHQLRASLRLSTGGCVIKRQEV